MGRLADLLERYVAAFNRGDHAAYAACYAPDVMLVNGAGLELHGPAAITEFYAAMRGKTHRELQVEGVVEGRDCIAAALRSRFVALEDLVAVGGSMLNTGDVFHLRSMALYEIESGLFKRIQATSLERTVVRKGEN
ncbi:MAG: nuclear transport factor 2 family protein [Alteraurantiacibacter sp.]